MIKKQEHNALEDVYLGDGTKVPAEFQIMKTVKPTVLAIEMH